MSVTARDATAIDTRQRILDVAGPIFAEHGFRAATIREICDKADANIAAVNYHFGSKENLYTEVLRSWLQKQEEKHPPDGGLRDGATAEERLRAFIRAVVLRILGDEGPPSWFSGLLAREMAEPTHALDSLVEEIFRPQMLQLDGIVRDLLGPEADPKQVRLCVWSVAGQWVVYHCGRNLMARLEPERKLAAEELELLAEHITRFSLNAVRGFRTESSPPQARPAGGLLAAAPVGAPAI